MTKWFLVCGLLVLLCSSPLTRCEDEEYDEDEGPESGATSEDNVMVLKDSNFDDVIKKHRFVLAEFYAPWCGHCKSLAPEYAKAATALKALGNEAVLAKIDATAETALGSRFDIKGYPTLKWFVDGEHVDYNGPRDADGIVAWVKRKTGPPTTTVEDATKLTELEAESPVVIVGYFAKQSGNEYETFKKVATKTEDVPFVETTSAAVAKAAGLEKAGVVAIQNFKGEDRQVVPYSGSLTSEEDLKSFVTAEKMPLTIEFSQETSEKIFNSGISKQLILWGTADQLEAGSPVYDAFKAAAKEFKGQLVFVTVNNEGSSHEPVTNFFGLKDSKAPVLLGFYMEKSKKYRMAESLDATSVKAFAQAVIDGTANVEYKSAPIPEDNKDDHVTIVVGKTVESIVFDESKDVLLEVYAPWCGHCKQLEPVFKKLAKRFAKVDSVVIAKMDGTENEHPELEVKGFPTLFFVPAEKGAKPIPYDAGDRSLKSLTKFIKKHAKLPYTLPKKSGGEDAESKSDKDEL